MAKVQLPRQSRPHRPLRPITRVITLQQSRWAPLMPRAPARPMPLITWPTLEQQPGRETARQCACAWETTALFPHPSAPPPPVRVNRRRCNALCHSQSERWTLLTQQANERIYSFRVLQTYPCTATLFWNTVEVCKHRLQRIGLIPSKFHHTVKKKRNFFTQIAANRPSPGKYIFHGSNIEHSAAL